MTMLSLSSLVSNIYDRLIVSMTTRWYQTVLEKVPDESYLLDVGIGTASALLACQALIREKKLKIVGIDYNSLYIETAKKAIEQHQMQDSITVHCMDIYDHEKLSSLLYLEKEKGKEREEERDKTNSSNLHETTKKYFHVIYFSGSFSLLPQPLEALVSIQSLLTPEDTGRIYITQTYQRHTPFLLHRIKPLLKYITTIDFGNLMTTEDILNLYQQSKMEVEAHEVIPNSVDNYWQAAYLSVLKVVQ